MIAVAITVFRPEPHRLEALLARLDGAFPLFVYVDGPVGEAILKTELELLQRRPDCTVIVAPSNAGIGHGLNRLCDAANSAGIERLLIFDQDSEPAHDHALRLIADFDRIHAWGACPAVIGPQPIVPTGESGKAPTYTLRGIGDLRTTDFVIVSGALVDLKALAAVGPFRADFIMDGIDIEWCFRAWAKGWSVWCDTTLPMPHRVGQGIMGWGPIRFPAQSLKRMSGYVHNQAIMMRLAHIPWRRKVRIAAYLPLQILVYALMHPRNKQSKASRNKVAHILLSAAYKGWNASSRA